MQKWILREQYRTALIWPVIEYFLSTPIGELFTTASANETQYKAGDQVYLRPEALEVKRVRFMKNNLSKRC